MDPKLTLHTIEALHSANELIQYITEVACGHHELRKDVLYDLVSDARTRVNDCVYRLECTQVDQRMHANKIVDRIRLRSMFRDAPFMPPTAESP